MAYTNESTPLELNPRTTKAHKPSYIKLLFVHADPHRPTKIHFLLSSIYNKAIFFHIDLNESI